MVSELISEILDDVWYKAFAILIVLVLLFRVTGNPMADSEYFICFLLFVIIAILDKMERRIDG